MANDPIETDPERLWILRYYKCIVNTQVFGTSNEHMDSQVFFEITRANDVGGLNKKQLVCTVRQPAGEQYNFHDTPLEVDLPEELRGRVNFTEFRELTEEYFRTAAGGFFRNGVQDARAENIVINNEAAGGLQVVGPANLAW